MEIWVAVASMKAFEDFKVVKGDVPDFNESDYVSLRSLCKENVCGRYGTNWGCPPGFSDDIPALLSRYSYVLILRKVFCLDVKDPDVVDAASEEMQRKVRMFVTELQSNGLECRGFSSGGCRYCGVCSYPSPCRYPEAMIASVSGLGIDMKTYLATVGEAFSFSDTCITLYGLIFVE